MRLSFEFHWSSCRRKLVFKLYKFCCRSTSWHDINQRWPVWFCQETSSKEPEGNASTEAKHLKTVNVKKSAPSLFDLPTWMLGVEQTAEGGGSLWTSTHSWTFIPPEIKTIKELRTRTILLWGPHSLFLVYLFIMMSKKKISIKAINLIYIYITVY